MTPKEIRDMSASIVSSGRMTKDPEEQQEEVAADEQDKGDYGNITCPACGSQMTLSKLHEDDRPQPENKETNFGK